MQEFGIMDPHQILYKFAVYAFEVKNEHKFECGFVSFNEVPLHCQIAFMVTLADGGKVIFEKNCLLKNIKNRSVWLVLHFDHSSHLGILFPLLHDGAKSHGRRIGMYHFLLF